VSRVLRPAVRHVITGHFRDESFQAITCTGTDNSKQTGENTPKTQNKKVSKTHKTPKLIHNSVPSTPVRTAHMCVLMIVYNCGTQYSTGQF